MEINAGHSNVQIAIAVQPQGRSTPSVEVDNTGGEVNTVAQNEPRVSLNTSGQQVGGFINTWA